MMLLRIALLLAVTGAWVTFTVTQASAAVGNGSGGSGSGKHTTVTSRSASNAATVKGALLYKHK